MLNYYCPGFYENQYMYAKYFKLRRENPECFYENVNIKYIFGSFPSCLWNGGGTFFGDILDDFKIRNVFNWYKNNKIILQLTFTNPLLEERDLSDRYCNLILRIAEEVGNVEVLVTSELLANYIKQNYPSLILDQSIIATTKKREEYSLDILKEDLKIYNKTVLPRIYNKDYKFLGSIPGNLRGRIEILVNDPCPADCPRIYSHYEDLARTQLSICNSSKNKCNNMEKCATPYTRYNCRKYNLEYKDLTSYELGKFTEIKISGRLNVVDGIIVTLYYLIKPEYQQDVLKILMEPFINYKYPTFNFN